MSRITVITGQYDQIIDAPIYDEAGRPLTFDENAAGISFIVFTPDTPKESRLVLPPSRYKDGRIYVNSDELQSLTAGELFLTIELSAGYDGYTDGSFDTGYTVQLQKYLKTDNPPQSTYDRIADLDKEIGNLKLDSSYNEDVHEELRAVDASITAALADLRRSHDNLETAVAGIEIPEIPEIPEKVSDLVNDASFVNKARVDGIDDRLSGAENAIQGLDASVKNTYTKDEVNGLISGLTSLDMEIVDELPAEPDLHTIYLLKEGALYGQYFYNTKVNDFVRISDTGVDLSAYLTQAAADQKYALESGLTDRIQGAVNTGVYTAEAVAAEMDTSVLNAAKSYTDLKKAAADSSIREISGSLAVVSDQAGEIPGLKDRLSALEASVGNIQPAAPGFRKITVNTLPPVSEADADAVYFLRSSNSEASNVYTEYTIVEGQYEVIGWAIAAAPDSSVDLSGFVSGAEYEVDKSAIRGEFAAADTSLKNYVDNLVNNIDTSVDLSDYATKDYVDNAAAALDASVKNVYTKAEVDQKIIEAGQGGEISLDGYAKTEDVSAADAAISQEISDVSTYVHGLVIPAAADVSKGYVDNQDTSLKDYVDSQIAAIPEVENYDDTEIRGLISDVSVYAHSITPGQGGEPVNVPSKLSDLQNDCGFTADSSFLVNTLSEIERHGQEDNPDVVKHPDIKIALGIPYYRDEIDHEEVRHKEILNITAGPGININTTAGTPDSSISVDTEVIATRQFVVENAYNDASVKADIQDVSSYAHSLVIPEIPQNVSAFTNDAGYLTEHQSLAGLATDASLQELAASIPAVESYDDSSLSQAIEDVSSYAHSIEIPAAYNDAEIRALIADVSTFSHNIRSGSPFTVVSSLPAISSADNSLIYMVPDAAGANNVYTEYVVVNGDWEIIGQGSLNINLAEYAKDASLQAVTGQINDVSAGLSAANAAITDVSAYLHALEIPEAYDDSDISAAVSAHDTSLEAHDSSIADIASKLEDVSAAVNDVSYDLPAATSQALGGIKLGFTQNDSLQAYPVLLSAQNQAYVIVPWTAGGISSSDVSSMISAALSDGNYLTSSSLTGLASESYVQSYVSTAVNNAGFLTSHQTLKTINGYSLIGSGNIQVSQDLTGYATQSWVNSQISGLTSGLSDASVRAIADSYDTSMQTYVQGAVSGIQTGGLNDASVRSIIESYGYMQAASYADIARQSWVEQRIVDLTSGGTVDLTSYASKNYVDTSITAVKTWVGQQGYLTSSALSNYVTKSALDASWVALSGIEAVLSDTSIRIAAIDASLDALNMSNYFTKAAADASWAAIIGVNLLDNVWTDNTNHNLYGLKRYFDNKLDTSFNAIDASVKALDASMKAYNLSDYYTKTQIDNTLAGYVNLEWIQGQGYLTSNDVSIYLTSNDISVYATQLWVQTRGYLTQHQSLEGLATDASLDEIRNKISAVEASVNLLDPDQVSAYITNVENAITYMEAVDASVKVYVDALDSSVNTHISGLDSSVTGYIAALDSSVQGYIAALDNSIGGYISDLDTSVNNHIEAFDTSANNFAEYANGLIDTLLAVDTSVKTYIADHDTSISNHTGAWDTSIRNYVRDFDTSIRAHVSAVDASINDHIVLLDSSIQGYIADHDTSINGHLSDFDTSIVNHISARDTSIKNYVDTVDSSVRGYVEQFAVLQAVPLTKAQYNALQSYSPNTIYLITD